MEKQENDKALSLYQSLALLIINSSPSTELATELINKNLKLINAVNFLKGTRLISYNPSGYKCTPHGIQQLKYNGFVNDNGSLTDKGKKLINTRSEYL
jgi:hypothetical protein